MIEIINILMTLIAVSAIYQTVITCLGGLYDPFNDVFRILSFFRKKRELKKDGIAYEHTTEFKNEIKYMMFIERHNTGFRAISYWILYAILEYVTKTM